MADALFTVEKLHLSLPDMAKKPLLGAAPRIAILKGLSFTLKKGAITGIVGESGSGKTSLGRTLIFTTSSAAGSGISACRSESCSSPPEVIRDRSCKLDSLMGAPHQVESSGEVTTAGCRSTGGEAAELVDILQSKSLT